MKNIVDCLQHTNPVNIKEYIVLAKTLVLASKTHIISILKDTLYVLFLMFQGSNISIRSNGKELKVSSTI